MGKVFVSVVGERGLIYGNPCFQMLVCRSHSTTLIGCDHVSMPHGKKFNFNFPSDANARVLQMLPHETP